MPETISNAKEIYHKLPRDGTGTSKIVPVRGVYVTGEYKPPIYSDPSIQLQNISTGPSTIRDWIETRISITDIKTTHHIYDISVDSTFSFDTYTTSSMPTQTDISTHHMYDISVDSSFNIDYYTTDRLPDQIDIALQHLYDISMDPDFEISYKTSIVGGSQPEPMLRLIEIDIGPASIINS